MQKPKCTMPGKVGCEPLGTSASSSVEVSSSSLDIGQSQFLTSPTPAQPLAFNLSLDDPTYDEETTHRIEDSDSRLMEMLAAQAAHREDEATTGSEDQIIADTTLPDNEKRTILQRSLQMAASNGDVERVNRVLQGKAKPFVDVNAADEEGRAPIIYAGCFVRKLPTGTVGRY